MVTLYAPSDCIPIHSLRAGIGASILETRNKPPTSGSRDKSPLTKAHDRRDTEIRLRCCVGVIVLRTT